MTRSRIRDGVGGVVAALAAFLIVAGVEGQQKAQTVPRLWTDAALRGWALPIAGVNATPRFYTEAEYYAAPVDELRTYPAYVKDREPKGYREGLLKQGPQPLIKLETLNSEAEWIAAGREVFDGMDVAENRTADPRALAWVDDPAAAAREHAKVAGDGSLIGVRWVVDRDRKLKLTLTECSACHTRVLPDGTVIRGAQGNLNPGLSVVGIIFENADKARARAGLLLPGGLRSYAAFGVPWLPDDINAGFKTMSAADREHINRAVPLPGTFSRFNGSPYFTNHMPDLIGVKDRKYLDATGTHRNRGLEDIARYGILVTDADDGAIGSYRFVPDKIRELRSRHSDEAMLALAKYIYSLQPPPNPNAKDALAAQGEQIFTASGCPRCHTPPLYTNNKLVPVDGFVALDHPMAPPAADIVPFARLGLDPGLALRTRKGTGYYKVPSLKGVWYRGPFEHSGSIATLEDWFDANRLKNDYVPTGWNPPGVKARAVPGHVFGLNLSPEDKRALIAFLRTL